MITLLILILLAVLSGIISDVLLNKKIDRLLSKDDERIMRYVEYVVKQLKEDKKPKSYSKWEC